MHKPGSIVRIKLENFVTYGGMVMCPAPGLNLIIGPNGTGKSTILSALVIGLGGNLSLIGRATFLGAYIKQGHDKAVIEIELANSPKNIIVKRTFTIAGSHDYEIDGEHKTASEVRSLCKKLNIQIDNLCQFLPQDRVQDFAKLNSQELLISTQRSVTSFNLLETHELLIKLSKDYVIMKDELEALKVQLNNAQQLNDRIQNVVANVEKQKKIIEFIKLHKIRLIWIIYQKAVAAFEEVKKDQLQIQNRIKKITQKVKKAEKEYQDVEKQLSSKSESISNMRRSVQFDINKIKDLHESCEQLEDAIREKKEEIIKKKKQAQTKDKEISQSKHLIQVMKNQVEQFKSKDEILQNMKSLNQAEAEFTKKINDLNSDRSAIVNELNNTVNAEIRLCKNKLTEIENVGVRKLKILKEINEDAYQATVWLKENEDSFQAKIYPPILIELNVKNPEHSKYLENTISKRDLLAFTCENIDDMNLFVKKVKMEMKLKISAVHSAPGYLKSHIPRLSLESIRKYGFFSYMLQLIDGPEPILSFLCKTYQVQNIPVGTSKTDSIADEVPSAIQLFYSDEFRYKTLISSYSGEKSMTTAQIGSRNLLNHSVDKTLELKYKQRLQLLIKSSDDLRNNISMIENKMQDWSVKRDQVLDERKSLQEKKLQMEHILKQIRIEEMKLQSLESDNYDMENEQRLYNEFLIQISKKMVSHHKDIQSKIKSLLEKNYEQAVDNISIRQLKETVNIKQTLFSTAKDELKDAEKTLQNVTIVYNHKKAEAKEKYEKALSLSDNLAPDDPKFPNKDKFNSLPIEVDVLEDIIEEQQSKADMLNVGDGNDYDEYYRRRQLIEQTTSSLESKTALIEECLKKMNETGDSWKSNIKNLIDKIGINFAKYMNYLQCSGDVTLLTPTPDHKYEDYGITIRVRFRGAEVLQELNRFTQSGGERAVATAIYLLSLQELTDVPFRCVDEINQGMDPVNERRVFELLTKSTGGQNTAQYFLLTPKLLPGLTYSPNIAIHCIYSGAVQIENKEICRNITV